MPIYRQVKKVAFNGIVFDSKLEIRKFHELKLLEAAKEITSLTYHPEPIKITIKGEVVFKFYPDFTYYDKNHSYTVLEVKGFQTPVFKLKWRILKAVYPDIIFKLWPDK